MTVIRVSRLRFIAALSFLALPVLAHHSSAMFDMQSEITLTGTVSFNLPPSPALMFQRALGSHPVPAARRIGQRDCRTRASDRAYPDT